MALSKENTEAMLQDFFSQLDDCKHKPELRLIGTAAAQIQDVPIIPADIDLLARTREDVDFVCDQFRENLEPGCPQFIQGSMQYYAAFTYQGEKLEVSTVEAESESDTLETYGSGPWRHYSMIRIGSVGIPVVALELRLVSEIIRRREDRIDILVNHLRENGFDRDLLERALSTQGDSYERLDKRILEEVKQSLGI